MKQVVVYLYFFILSCTITTAQNKSRKVRNLENKRKELQQKIKNTDKELKSTKKEKKETEKHLSLINTQVKQREEMISVIGNEIQEIQVHLDSISNDIDILSKQEYELKKKYENSLKYIQLRNPKIDNIIFILSSESFDKALERQDFIKKYSSNIKNTVIKVKEISSKKKRLQIMYSDGLKHKEDLLNIRTIEKQNLEKEKQNKKTEFVKLQKLEKELSNKLSRQKQEADQLNQQILRQIEKEIAESNRLAEKRKRKRNNSTKSKTNKEDSNNSVKTYAMDENEIKLSGSFSNNRSRLPMPVRGAYSIIRHYGVQQHNTHSRISTNNAGIDIRPMNDSNCYVVFEGVVSRVFATTGFNTSIIIRHGNYLTVYSNLQNAYVKQGDRVSTGSIIGKIAIDGENTDYRKLHFQLWHEQNKQNPEKWLRK